MKCVVCHGEEIVQADVFEEIAVGTDIVRVPIRVLVCQTCGEAYVDEATTAHLIETADEAARTGVELDVREYAGA